MLRYLFNFIFFASAVAAAVDSTTQSQTGTLITFTNSTRGYSIDYPLSWFKNTEMKDFDLFIMAPKDAEGRSLANLSIISAELPKDVDLDLYYRENVQNLLKENPTAQVKEKGKTTVAGVPSLWIRYTRDDNKLEIIHYFIVVQGVGYLITCGATVEVFNQYQATFDQMIESFRFL